jgi:outer membrane protein
MRFNVIVFCLLGSCVSLFAQDSTSSTLTFRDAVQIALKNNVTLNQQRNNLFQSQVQKTYAIGQMGPTASVNGAMFRNNGNSFIQQRAEVVNATVDVVQAQLQVQMPLFGGFNNLNLARSASTQLDAQLHQVTRSTQDVINIVSTQYLQVLMDQELVKIARENLEVQKKQYEMVKEQVALGSRSPVDEYNQQALVSSAEVRLVQAEYTLVNDRTTLFQSLVVDPTVVTTIVEPSWDVNAIALDNQDLNQLLAVAAENRSDLKQAKLTEKSSRFAMNSWKGNYFPNISAFYNYGSAYNQVKGTPRDSLYRDFNNQFFNDNRSSTIGLSFNIPIFSGFRNRYSYVQSKVQYENSKLTSKSREILVKGDVLRAFENFESVKKGYTAGLTGLEASEMAYKLEKERYELGITSFVDFANANRTYIQAQTDMAQAKYRFLFQKIMLDYAVGTLKPEDLPQ